DRIDAALREVSPVVEQCQVGSELRGLAWLHAARDQRGPELLPKGDQIADTAVAEEYRGMALSRGKAGQTVEADGEGRRAQRRGGCGDPLQRDGRYEIGEAEDAQRHVEAVVGEGLSLELFRLRELLRESADGARSHRLRENRKEQKILRRRGGGK